MKPIILSLAMFLAVSTPAQTDSCFPHCHKCQVYVAEVGSRRILKNVEFSPLTGEEELTNKELRIPGLIVTASVFYTDESMASSAGVDSMQLALAVSKHHLPNAFGVPNNAITEITLSTFGTARVQFNVRSGSRRLLIDGM